MMKTTLKEFFKMESGGPTKGVVLIMTPAAA